MSRWLTIGQAAKRVDRDERTIRRWVVDGLPIVNGLIAENHLLAFDRKRRGPGRPKRGESLPERLRAAEATIDRIGQIAVMGGGGLAAIEDEVAKYRMKSAADVHRT